MTKVYVLDQNLADPRFRGCVFARKSRSVLGFENPVMDFLPQNLESLDWSVNKLSSSWKPQTVKGPASGFNDYPCLEMSIPVFSTRAVDGLTPILQLNGELLPLKTDIGSYWAFNLETKLDALDLKKSEISRTGPKKTAVWASYFSFKPSKLKSATIFRVRELPSFILVTDLFRERVERAGLNGFVFNEVWPLPEGTNWRLEAAARSKKNKSRRLAGESLILRFRLKLLRPNPKEKEFAKRIEKQLRDLLEVKSLNDKFYGSVECTEIVDGEFRVFCVCPSTDELAAYLSDWLSHDLWGGEVDIVKRYGNLFDEKAKEKRIVIRKI